MIDSLLRAVSTAGLAAALAGTTATELAKMSAAQIEQLQANLAKSRRRFDHANRLRARLLVQIPVSVCLI